MPAPGQTSPFVIKSGSPLPPAGEVPEPLSMVRNVGRRTYVRWTCLLLVLVLLLLPLLEPSDQGKSESAGAELENTNHGQRVVAGVAGSVRRTGEGVERRRKRVA